MSSVVIKARSIVDFIISDCYHRAMNTVTLSKTEFDVLRKRAALYEAILKSLPEKKWNIEEYTTGRIREFLREDRLDKKVRARARKLLSSR